MAASKSRTHLRRRKNKFYLDARAQTRSVARSPEKLATERQERRARKSEMLQLQELANTDATNPNNGQSQGAQLGAGWKICSGRQFEIP